MASRRSWSNTCVGAVAACLFAALISYVLASQRSTTTLPMVTLDPSLPTFNATGQTGICLSLDSTLPGSIYSDHHPSFHDSINSYWSRNARELKPSCIVRPSSVQEVAAAVKVLKSEYDTTKDTAKPLEFAIRSGGHSPEVGFANVDGGVVVDMTLMNEVTVSEDKQSVVLGVGARWADVSTKLDSMGLAVVGGRSSYVGVGGLVLGGKYNVCL